ncbi:MAG: PAS domain-containing sensor histidine kinase, partial [Halobacteria archaeon]|nr:PAS domain-containing sensor histidine kinase [Halobacteria archaeon]
HTGADREVDYAAELLRKARQEGYVEDEGWRVRKDGSEFWANIVITALRDDGELRGYSKVTRDMTERKKSRERMMVMSRVLRHDIRNWANVVLGNAEIIRGEVTERDDLDDLGDFDIENVREKSLAIKDAASDIVELSEKTRRIQESLSGKREETKMEMDVVDKLETMVEMVRDEYPDIDISFDAPGSAMVSANKHLGFALENLIHNPVEHNESSDLEIDIRAEEDEHPGYVELKILDNGTGIPRSEIDVLENEEETELSHSSGMGLWLVKWIVEESDGYIEFSNDGNGVTVRLPRVQDGSED